MVGIDYEINTHILEEELRKRISLLEHLLIENLRALKDQLKHNLQQLPKELLHKTLEEILLQHAHFQFNPQTLNSDKDIAIVSTPTHKR
jgi:hypothetical protein